MLIPEDKESTKMKYWIGLITIMMALGSMACSTDSPRYADPPPGSHSPFASDRDDGTADRDRPDPQPDEPEEEEPDEPVDRN